MMIPLALMIALADGSRPTTESILLDAVFRNVSSTPVRLLNTFADEKNLSIWFHLEMTALDGTPVLGIAAGGKINLRGSLTYETIPPGGTFGVRLNVAKFVTSLRPGTYTLQLTYRNQYGEDCFKGEVKSNTLKVVVAEQSVQAELLRQ